MKRIFAVALCALGLAAAIAACGGGGDDGANADKLTIVGSGS
ncbi:MAG TPA: hypothetical protein VNU71_09120 [Burkholderiaceae bacterium]|nr:hypothetical protein [Burkholderiaceae bacterium]